MELLRAAIRVVSRNVANYDPAFFPIDIRP
jgi:hypothetical protein